MGIEIRTRAGWTAIERRPSIVEDEWFELRGHPGATAVTFGGIPIALEQPVARVRLVDHDDLRCHIGLLAVATDGEFAGEIDVRPGKLTEDNWTALRRELDAVWTGLVLDDPAPTSVEASGPDPIALWHSLGPVVANLAEHPVRTLGTHERWVRRERARSASEMTVSVALAGMRGQPGRARSIAPVIAEAERALVRDCLQRLLAYARRHRHGESVSSAVARFLTIEPFAQPSRSAVTVTHLARHEPRLRQVVSVRQTLLNASSLITEGPGELRLGLKGLDKLYEYWVFLKVLQQLRLDFGEPLGRGFDQLAVRLPGGRLRLELPAGTTIDFPGGVTAAFSPTITQTGRNSWQSLELASPPASTGLITPFSVEPDIVVQGGPDHSVLVVDAKYRARHRVDEALWDIHRKYGRFRRNGIGVVTEVIVAQPHATLTLRWAGQRAVPFVPGGIVSTGLWPQWERPAPPVADGSSSSTADDSDPSVDTDRPTPTADAAIETTNLALDNETPSIAEATEPLAPPPPAAIHSSAAGTPPRPIFLIPPPPGPAHRPPHSTGNRIRIEDVDLVICDQQWTSTMLFGRRLDLLALRQTTGAGKPSYMIGSDHGTLGRFHDAAYHRGWNIVVARDRGTFLDKVDDLLRRLHPKVIALITANTDVIELAHAHGCIVDVVDDLGEMMMR